MAKSEQEHGLCAACGRTRYRHRDGCGEAGEASRRKLLAKHDIDPGKFEAFLRVLARQYKKLARVPLV